MPTAKGARWQWLGGTRAVAPAPAPLRLLRGGGAGATARVPPSHCQRAPFAVGMKADIPRPGGAFV